MEYQTINKELWNNKVETHLNSAFYDMPSFLEGKTSLKSIELELLGDISGKRILHLQCHFGQDSLSLARMGAIVTGADLSDKAIATARTLNEQLGLNATFVCCDLYDLPRHLSGQFDVVFTSYGTIGWLPDLDTWAKVITHFLAPEGRFVFAEFHPVVWMYDDDFQKVTYNYAQADPIIEETSGTYADRNASLVNQSVSWNHGLAEVHTALIKNGLSITDFREYDYSPYPCFAHLEEFETGKFRIKHFGNLIPMVYSLIAQKR